MSCSGLRSRSGSRSGLALVLVFVLEHTPFGRQLYAIGGSERVALLAGNPCQSVQSAGVRGSRVACERCGPIRARPKRRRQSAVRARTASACLCRRFFGVTTYRPGYFNIPGAVIAIVLLAVGFNRMNLLGVPYWLCAKSALPKLKVAADWRVPVHRNRAEVAWMQVRRRAPRQARFPRSSAPTRTPMSSPWNGSTRRSILYGKTR